MIARIKSSLHKKNRKLDSDVADAICYVAANTSHSITDIRELDVGSFFVLVQYVGAVANKEAKVMNKASKKGKVGKRRR